MKFVVDSMLGRLARWLRVLGCDTHYQTRYPEEALARLVGEGRILLTRNAKTARRIPGSLWIRSDHVGEQMWEIKGALAFRPQKSLWFTRCLRCNAPLESVGREEAKANVPEYVFHESGESIRRCTRCGRYYWPGTHRLRMIRQLEAWGL